MTFPWSANENLFVRIRKGTNGEEFQKKIAALRINDIEKENELGELLLTPLSALRYSGYVSREDTVITFSYILYFSLAGGLVIICSLFNYLTLYISRLYMRRREMALRKVNGAGNKDLFVQLTVELLIVQFIALVAGLFFIEICMSRFLEFTRIAPNSYYGEILVYLFIVIALSLLLAQIPLYHFRRRTLQDAVKGKVSVNRPYAFRKFGIVIQLIVSLVFIFCTVVIMKQIYFLKHTDLGMERHNIANVALWRGDIKQWGGKIAALPMVTEVLPPRYFPIIPTGSMMCAEMNHWEDNTCSVFRSRQAEGRAPQRCPGSTLQVCPDRRCRAPRPLSPRTRLYPRRAPSDPRLCCPADRGTAGYCTPLCLPGTPLKDSLPCVPCHEPRGSSPTPGTAPP